MTKTERIAPRPSQPVTDDELLEQWRLGLRISKHALDDALEHDAVMIQEVGDAFSLACSRRDGLKLERDETLARLDIKYRADAEASGAKVTEKSIQSQIDLNIEAKNIRRDYLKACEYADRLDVMVRAYYARAADIRALGELFKASYFTINNHVRARDNEADAMGQRGANVSRGFGKGADK